MKLARIYMFLLGINIVLLLVAFIFNETLKGAPLYIILIFVMITTPFYLFKQLKAVEKAAKEEGKK